jgi:hypothetical protein
VEVFPLGKPLLLWGNPLAVVASILDVGGWQIEPLRSIGEGRSRTFSQAELPGDSNWSNYPATPPTST